MSKQIISYHERLALHKAELAQKHEQYKKQYQVIRLGMHEVWKSMLSSNDAHWVKGEQLSYIVVRDHAFKDLPAPVGGFEDGSCFYGQVDALNDIRTLWDYAHLGYPEVRGIHRGDDDSVVIDFIG